MLATSCQEERITPSETITTETYTFPAITALTASEDFVVFYTTGAVEQSVEVEANLNLQDKVDIKEEDGRLKIGLKNNVSIRGNETLILRLSTVAPINDFRASSDAEINIQSPLTLENLYLKATSDALIRATLDVNFVEADVTSDGRLELIGTVERLEADLSSDGALVDFDLAVDHLDMELSSDAEASLTVIETLSVEATSGATLRYQGDPEILRLNTSSDGAVEKVD